MDDDLDFNPFPTTSTVITEQQKAQLFYQSRQGDQQALETLAKSYSDVIEAIILQLQQKNIPEKHTFTYLFDDCLQVLKSSIIRYKRFEDFDKKFDWIIRQYILQKLA